MPLDGSALQPNLELVSKLDKVAALLSGGEKWCKQRLRDEHGRRCILGALMAADAVMDLGPVIKKAIQHVTGRDYLRIECFNDDPKTDFAHVEAVLREARRLMLSSFPAAQVTPPPPKGFWATIRGLFTTVEEFV